MLDFFFLRHFVPENKHLFVQHIHLMGFTCLISATSTCAHNDLKHSHWWFFPPGLFAGLNFQLSLLLFFFFFLNPAANSRPAHRLCSEAFLRQLDTTLHDSAVCWLSCGKSRRNVFAVSRSWNGFRPRGRASVRFAVSGVTVAALLSKRTGSSNGR